MVFEKRSLESTERQAIMSSGPQPPRTYNQNHAPRKYTPGKRRVSIYWTWSYPWEANRNTTELDNRFSTMTEVRRVAWPAYEGTEWDEMHFLQGIAGTLELFHRSTLAFQRVVGEVTGHSVAVFQRIDQAGYKLPIDERILADTDTLMVFGLDHLLSDVGFTEDLQQRQLEYTHHGDALVPRQQRFGQYTRSMMKALGVPVMNQFGLRPALVKGTKQIAPLTINKDVDELGLLNGVTTFNFHPHLPHYALTTDDTKFVHVLTRQPIDLDRPHPFTQAGNTEFNSFIWMPPNAQRAGNILLADSTIFTTLFGGVESLETFWKNLAKMPLASGMPAKKTQAVA
jgi:hypothetical protein